MKCKTMEDLIATAREAILDSSESSSIYVGCDSLRRKKGKQFYATYATVVIIHKDSKHGGAMYSFEDTQPDYGSMKQRLLTEVGYAVQVASELIDIAGPRNFEIHLDINPDPKHKSSCAAKEGAGYVLGSFGFEPKLKPQAWAATHGSDHIVRH